MRLNTIQFELGCEYYDLIWIASKIFWDNKSETKIQNWTQNAQDDYK